MNLPTVEIVEHCGVKMICVVTSGFPDNFRGCYWQLYDLDGKIVGYGESKGWGGNGAGSALTAMKNAKTSARRRIARRRGAVLAGPGRRG
jgi:hypothetical protein